MAFAEEQADLLPCPRCGELTDSLKQYRYWKWFVFLLAGAFWQEAIERACPRCMRGWVWKSLLINIPLANFLWPFLVLPWGLVLLAVSCRKGHSPVILQELTSGPTRLPPPPGMFATRGLEEQISSDGMSWPRVMAIVALLVCWLPGLGLLFSLWALYLNRREPVWQWVCSVVALSVAGVVSLALVVLVVAAPWLH
jgi:hypothetical protein